MANRALCYTDAMIIAIDTGGTKTLLALFSLDGTMQKTHRFPTPKDQEQYLAEVTAGIKALAEDSVMAAISVAIPGPIKHGIVQRTPNIGWTDFDVVNALQVSFPETPIFLGNDADLGGVGESNLLDNPKLCLYITASTGVGAGLTYQGKLFSGIRRFEGGSMRIEYRGQRMRWENVASGQSFYERYGQYGSEVTDPAKWADFADRLSRGLLVLIPLLEPDTVILGGSMGTHFAKYSDQLQAILDKEIAKHMSDVDIVQAKYPEEAVVYGCYFHAVNQLAS